MEAAGLSRESCLCRGGWDRFGCGKSSVTLMLVRGWVGTGDAEGDSWHECGVAVVRVREPLCVLESVFSTPIFLARGSPEVGRTMLESAPNRATPAVSAAATRSRWPRRAASDGT